MKNSSWSFKQPDKLKGSKDRYDMRSYLFLSLKT